MFNQPNLSIDTQAMIGTLTMAAIVCAIVFIPQIISNYLNRHK